MRVRFRPSGEGIKTLAVVMTGPAVLGTAALLASLGACSERRTSTNNPPGTMQGEASDKAGAQADGGFAAENDEGPAARAEKAREEAERVRRNVGLPYNVEMFCNHGRAVYVVNRREYSGQDGGAMWVIDKAPECQPQGATRAADEQIPKAR